jgi:hypothetical protein
MVSKVRMLVRGEAVDTAQVRRDIQAWASWWNDNRVLIGFGQGRVVVCFEIRLQYLPEETISFPCFAFVTIVICLSTLSHIFFDALKMEQ